MCAKVSLLNGRAARAPRAVLVLGDNNEQTEKCFLFPLCALSTFQLHRSGGDVSVGLNFAAAKGSGEQLAVESRSAPSARCSH